MTGTPGNFRVKVTEKPRYIDLSKCTGCGDCGLVTLGEHESVKEAHGLLWVDRVRIDESKCIHCGDCVRACVAENPQMQGMSNIVTQRLNAVIEPQATQLQLDSATLLQRVFLMTAEERKAFWDEQFRKCIKCYGCVDICPVHVDRTDGFNLSEEILRGEIPPQYPLFHFLRGYNVWDTCIVCGECEKTCPAGIPLKTFQDMIVFLPPEQVFELVPGLSDHEKARIVALVEQRKEKIDDAA